MTKKQKAAVIGAALAEYYPDATCALDYTKPYELVIATRLSAQCTDKRVNVVTKTLFATFPTLEAFATASPEEVEQIVRPCGLGNTKARDIVAMAGQLIARFDGVVPSTMEELLSLPGVGRKTANLILGDIFHQPAIVCDTHCIRITGRLGLADSANPAVVENQLGKILAPAGSNDFCHRLVLFGRDTCLARSPKCGLCPLREWCVYVKQVKKM